MAVLEQLLPVLIEGRPIRDVELDEDARKRLRGFRFLTRGLGTRETRSADLLSMVMFQPDYLGHIIDLGEHDAEMQAEAMEAFFENRPE